MLKRVFPIVLAITAILSGAAYADVIDENQSAKAVSGGNNYLIIAVVLIISAAVIYLIMKKSRKGK